MDAMLNPSGERKVPRKLAIKILFSGVLSIIGWGFIGIGMIFVWVFAVPDTIYETIVFLQESKTTEGSLTMETPTSINVGGDSLIRYEFEYQVDGVTYKGFSYSTSLFDVDQSLQIDYITTNPEMSRIRGETRAIIGPSVLVLLLFPALGLTFVLIGLPGRMRNLRLLRYGVRAEAALDRNQATNTTINGQRVRKYFFVYHDHSGLKHEFSVQTHKPDLITDEAKEQILFDPRQPEQAVVLQNLPGAPAFTWTNELEYYDVFGVAQWLPFTVVSVHTIAGIIYFLI